ncbi:damaged DNA binding 2 [Artemisia annua]|uniref:Damaged DNA binding 2 n=1 Tax=Artemisia annua TaxID=35608 RepID=A0A2U1N7X2_ARTAN|nr:damaged DNA binding 2 [Artemisia annua]
MTARTRRTLFPKVVIERDTDTDESSDDEEELEAENDVVESGDEEEVENEGSDEKSDVKGKAPITISLKKVCKVCKKTGHQAGFQGATYIDCPMKPCFLCKLPGHTTVDCPHRVAMEFGVIPASRKRTNNSLDYVFERQMRPRVPSIKPPFVIPDEVNCAVIRYHSRRITCLEFHPTNNNILLSGDKKGQLGVWDFSKVYEKTVYGNIHSCLLNNMKFSPANDGTVYSASSDGTVNSTDLETGLSTSIMNLNPNGWQGVKSWRMLYGMELNTEKNLVLVADSFGYLHLVDVRSDPKKGDSVLIHKKGTKVVGLHCNPLQPDLLLSCGNDHFARIWDMRRLEAESCLHELPHKRVVNSAYFSPLSGSKIITTSIDNRIRVWDSIFGNLDNPSREIVHSHDFNRHLTPFRAEWDPKDPSESLVVIGRYISENYNGAALHPIDFIDISTGQLVAEVMDPNITTISPVNKLHPRDDVLASGSSSMIPGTNLHQFDVWNDGYFAHLPFRYQDGVILNMAVERMPYEKFAEFLEEKSGNPFQVLYYKVPNVELENGLVRVSDDKEVAYMFDVVDLYGRLELYLDHLGMDLSEYEAIADTSVMDASVSKAKGNQKRYCNDFSVDELVDWAEMEVEYEGSSSHLGDVAGTSADGDVARTRVDVDKGKERSIDYLSPGEEELIELRKRIKANREKEHEPLPEILETNNENIIPTENTGNHRSETFIEHDVFMANLMRRLQSPDENGIQHDPFICVEKHVDRYPVYDESTHWRLRHPKVCL